MKNPFFYTLVVIGVMGYLLLARTAVAQKHPSPTDKPPQVTDQKEEYPDPQEFLERKAKKAIPPAPRAIQQQKAQPHDPLSTKGETHQPWDPLSTKGETHKPNDPWSTKGETHKPNDPWN